MYRAAGGATGLHDQSLRRIAGRAARLGGWAIDLETDELYWSDEVCEIHDLPPGYRPTLDEGLGYFPKRVRARVREHMRNCLEQGIPYDLELPKYTASGRLIWVRSIGEAVRDESGRIVRLQGAFQDITRRKHNERKLRHQAAMLDNANDAIMATDMNWRLNYWNRAAEALYGWTAEEALGRTLHELLQVDPVQTGESIAQLVETGSWKGDIVKTARDGSRLTISASWTLIRDECGEPDSILAIDTDVTHQREIEEQLRHTQKMEAIGTLAGGIAHDFNNLLMVINSYSEHLQNAPGLLPEQRWAAGNIHKAGTRAATMTRQLLGFSGKSPQHLSVFDLNPLVEKVAVMLERVVDDSTRVVTVLEPALRQARLDAENMEQVLIQLVGNARDAMPEGGTLGLETANVQLDEEQLQGRAEAVPGAYVVLRVRDTGCGMKAELLDRIFEPFFTTKEVGRGTGLGLSMALGVVRQGGGWIQVDSEPGKGSCFSIYCPVHGAAGES